MSNSFTVLLTIILVILFGWQLFYDRVLLEKILVRRKKKVNRMLSEIFEVLVENEFGFLEYNIAGKRILLECNPFQSGRSIHNNINVHLDITHIEEDIKNLCKIHFNCSKINEQDYVSMPVRVIFLTLRGEVKHTKKVVNQILSETEFYIAQKRAERDKKLN